MRSPLLIRVGIVGATGYSGQELIRLVMNHPLASVTYLAATSDAGLVRDLLPQFRGATLPAIEAYDADRATALCDAVFVALPSGVSGRVAADLWERGLRVIDLSGDLRLPADDYRTWYGKEPVGEKALSQAVYGLSEWNQDAIESADLIANPGCYATATLLALMPLGKAGLLAGKHVTVDAKSGVSGAGRAPKLANQLAELSDNFFPYKVGGHQHTPEVEQKLGNDIRILLTTQLLPMTRGIYVCAYVPDASASKEIRGLYETAYAEHPFVSLLPSGVLPQLKAVRGSNSCHIQVMDDSRTGTLMVFSAIDNLQKGASGQAVQNLNLMYGLPIATGLSVYGLAP